MGDSAMTYKLTTSHTFTSTDAEDMRFPTARDAWEFAAVDYAVSDHGEDDNRQLAASLALSRVTEPGSVTLPSGETITVTEITRHFHTGRNLPGYLPESDVTC